MRVDWAGRLVLYFVNAESPLFSSFSSLKLVLSIKLYLLWKFKINPPHVLFSYPWEAHQKSRFIKRKRNLACRELLKWTKRLALARNASSCIPKSIDLKVLLLVSPREAGEAGGALPLPEHHLSAPRRERAQEAGGSAVPPSAQRLHLTLSNSFTQQMEKRCLVAVAAAPAWSDRKGLQGMGWENFWWMKDDNLGVQSLPRHSQVRPERCWPCWVNFQS